MVSNQPWMTGGGKMTDDILNVKSLEVDDIIRGFEFNENLDKWISENPHLFKEELSDTSRKGGMKNLIASTYTEKKISSIKIRID